MRGASAYLYLLMLINFILKDSKDSNDSFCSLLSLCAVRDAADFGLATITTDPFFLPVS